MYDYTGSVRIQMILHPVYQPSKQMKSSLIVLLTRPLNWRNPTQSDTVVAVFIHIATLRNFRLVVDCVGVLQYQGTHKTIN